MKGKLYLIPSTLGDSEINKVIPSQISEIVSEIKCFIVENERTARRYLKRIVPEIIIDELDFYILNKHTSLEEMTQYLNPVFDNNNIGILSEAGCPGIADPGSDIVTLAHDKGIQVIPLVGPSSIILSLMASGMNGQSFAFVGYLPIKPVERAKMIRHLESKSKIENQTQIFIETPYRNNQLINDIIKICSNSTRLCIACDLTLESEFVVTRTISEWKKQKHDFHKRPCIFLIHAFELKKKG